VRFILLDHIAVPRMRPTVTDGLAWSVCQVGRPVCLSVTIVSPAKSAEPIEIPFGLWIRVRPRNHVLDGGPDQPCEGAILRAGERGGPLQSIGTVCTLP